MSVAPDLPVIPTKAMVPLGDLQTFTVSTALGFYPNFAPSSLSPSC
jgi:hypothetical protein